MRVEPAGAELLQLARDALLVELLPKLPESNRYAARMVANAMAIAAREMQAQCRVEDEVERLRGLLPGWAPPAEASEACRDGAKRLAEALREGRLDSRTHDVLLHLRATTRERLAVSNPRALPKP